MIKESVDSFVKVSSVTEMSFRLKLESYSWYHYRLSPLKLFLINPNFLRKCQNNNSSSCTGVRLWPTTHADIRFSLRMQIFKVTYSCTHRKSLQTTHGLWKTPTVLTDEAEYTMEPEDRDLNRDLTGKQRASASASQRRSHKENSPVLFHPEEPVLAILPVQQRDLFSLWLILQ